MSTRKKQSNFIQRLVRTVWQFFNGITKGFIRWLLRSLLISQRRTRLSQAGFVLPTIIMVSLVVVLLTTAILFRSFDRSKNASNYRVNEAVLNAASPALDRSRAKLNQLFSPAESALKGNTPADSDIAPVIENPKYTLGDEIQLKLVKEFNGTGGIQDSEKLKSAWMFPVDTDNNGLFDSFTLYGIYYRTPNTATPRSREPLEARARPQLTGAADSCAAGNGGGAEGGDDGSGWFSVSGQLKKAFFTYVASVPISSQQFTELQGAGYKDGTVPGNKFEAYKGNKGFSALEMQQDQARISLDNNAVWYEDDLIITDVPDAGFKLNGRVVTNGNLMLGTNQGDITFYQVSSPWSCFYTAENSKIIVGGNVAANGLAGDTDQSNLGNSNVKVHLFKQKKQPFNPNQNGNSFAINDTNVTTTDLPKNMAFNSRAYAQRLKVLVDGGMNEYRAVNGDNAPTLALVQAVTRFPAEIALDFEKKFPKNNGATLSDDEANSLLQQVIEAYFKQRIRRVPYTEVAIDNPQKALEGDGGAVVTAQTVFSGGGDIMPPKKWMLIEDPNGHTPNGYTNVNLKFAGTTMELEQNDPQKRLPTEPENLIGDRVLVGNGLPIVWLKPDNTYATPAEQQKGQDVFNGGTRINWNSGEPRQRANPAKKLLDDLGDTSRNGFWEKAAADPKNVPGDEELAGGLRIVTGAGIYLDGIAPTLKGTGERRSNPPGLNALAREKSFLPEPPVTPQQLKKVNAGISPAQAGLKQSRVVWPDTMPMYLWDDKPPVSVYNPNNTDVFKGDLQMRATVVYHYNSPDPDAPIACISSYYDPTNDTTAKNAIAVDPGGDAKGVSNNGLNYEPSGLKGLRAATPALIRQAYMVFPDGRWVNEPLKKAIEALQSGRPLSFEQKAALDAGNCALGILDGSLGRTAVAPGTANKVPDGAIRERAFLDARQVKTLHKPGFQFGPDGITPTAQPIQRETFIQDPLNPDKVVIADPEELKIATQKTLNEIPPTTLSQYSLPIEQRQPLEIRVTEIDIEKLRIPTFGTFNGKPEYLLPNSGIIYATRDDALPDITDANISAFAPQLRVDGGGSATDFKLDPGRRPNGIRLWSSGDNGGRISRGATNIDRPEEKGLILASNLPVYIKGDFNRHYVFGSKNPTEEFQAKVDPNNYEGTFYNRQGAVDPNFACRSGGSKANCAQGDQWRAARILSDAITLLSNDFRDGFRNEADYDLNNNAGNVAVAARLKNGFWWNGFATNYSYGADYPINATFPEQDALNPAAETKGSSYAMNGVTPIQRRANFPQYLMEACTKLPVSECSPQDWRVGGPGKKIDQFKKASEFIGASLPVMNNSGTTAKPPKGELLKSSPRRVAFKRNPEFGTLELPASCQTDPGDSLKLANCNAIPLGIGTGNKVIESSYKEVGSATPVAAPQAVDNALWYATTSDATNTNPSPATPSYDKTNLLYYLPDDLETVPTERQMLLPGAPKFPQELGPVLANPANNFQSVLNGITAADPSDFAVCLGTGLSNPTTVGATRYQVDLSTLAASAPCAIAQPKIQQMWQALSGLTTPIPNVLAVTANWNPATTKNTATATAKVNVFDLAPALNNVVPTPITLDRGNQSDPIFVIRSAALPRPLKFLSTELTLNGVDPNNIFWVARRGLQIDNTSKLVGNFIGRNNSPLIVDGTAIKAGRILGFTPNAGAPPTGAMTAMTTAAQPLLVPILQLHSPEGEPSTNAGTAFRRSPATDQIKWLQRATPTNYNAALIMGDTPARPFPTGGGENGGGLHNFPRFLENWVGVDATIKGSLIQYTKSKYATAPFDAIDLVGQDNSLFFDGLPPAYRAGDPINGYQYKEAAASNKAPYYQPPGRKWGYDVGLLSQTPDLFSRRFAQPEAGTPNEFFREVSRDDGWVQNLLCAAKKTTGSNTYDQWAITDPNQRPASCKDAQPGGQYNASAYNLVNKRG
ncbi:MAG TPA: hormogonium polysaccharide biosynthesis protein HpsA [Coleofasciculaceae cyanobacterium]|jgi:hypothetical protein